jgi:protein O-mannosyl-transferase
MRTSGEVSPVSGSVRGGGAAGRPSRNRVDRCVATVVIVAALGAFLPVLNNRFVDHWDDQTNFLDNQEFRGLGWPQVRWAWTTCLQGAYQPLTWMLLEAEYVTWGLDPRGYHLASMALHAVDAFLLFVLIRTLLSRALPGIEPGLRWAIPVMSGLAAAVFAVHPLRVEVVAWASGQGYLPCAGLAMLSVLAYVRGCGYGPRRPGWLFASVLLFAAALGCKAVPVGLPLVLLILDATLLGRMSSARSLPGLLAEKVPYVIPAIAASWMAVQAKSDLSRPEYPPAGPARLVARRVAVAGYGLGYYLDKTVRPWDLSAYRFRPDPIRPAEPRFAVSLAVVAALGIIAYSLRRRWPAIPAALLSYAILLAPNLGLVQYGLALVADRYAYLATMPLFVIAAGWLVRRIVVSPRPAALAGVILVIGLGLVQILSALSWAQCRTWRDSETLWSHALRVGSGRDAVLESNIGIELFNAGRIEEGMARLRNAVRIDPADAEAQGNLGLVLFLRGDVSAAITPLAEAVRLSPDRADLRCLLGRALAQQGWLGEAAEQLAEAVRLRPDNAEAHVSLGNVLAALHRRDEAVAEFTRALLLVPGHEGAWRGLEKLRDAGRNP